MTATAMDLKRNSGLPTLGTHTFEITRGQEREGPSGYNYWLYFCTVIDNSPDRGKQASLNLSHSPDARFRVDEFLDAVGSPEEGKVVMEDFYGRTFRGVVAHNVWDGKTRANIETCLPISETQLPFKSAPSTLPADTQPSNKLPF